LPVALDLFIQKLTVPIATNIYLTY